MSSDRFDSSRTLPVEAEGIARQRIRVTLRMLGSLLLGGVATMGSVLVFRQGLLPLIDTVFQPGPAWLSVFRRAAVAPLESRYAGPDWLTGGMFGPESSLLVIVSAAVVVVLVLRAARRRGAFLKPVA